MMPGVDVINTFPTAFLDFSLPCSTLATSRNIAQLPPLPWVRGVTPDSRLTVGIAAVVLRQVVKHVPVGGHGRPPLAGPASRCCAGPATVVRALGALVLAI